MLYKNTMRRNDRTSKTLGFCRCLMLYVCTATLIVQAPSSPLERMSVETVCGMRLRPTSSDNIRMTPMGTRSFPGDTAVFIFQNNFWVNLHHFLRGEARRRSLNLPLELPLSKLSVNERAAWEAALDAYIDLAKRSLLFDAMLVRIDNILARVTDTTALKSNKIDPKIVAALDSAAPIYRAHLWDQHRRANDYWIATYGPAIRQHAVAVKKAIADAFQAIPPNGPILVDLARDTGPTLAYTTEGPAGTAGHTVLAPQKNSDPEVALDTIFHEISHTMDNQITQLIDGEAKRQGIKIPPDLWHAMTLYTTSEIVKREMGKQGDPTYRPDAARVEMFKKSGWEEILFDMEKFWRPYLEGKTSLQSALHDLIQSVAHESSNPT